MIYGDGDVSRLINVPLRRCAPGKPTTKMSAGRMSLYSLTSLIYATGGKPGRAIHYVYVSQKIRTYGRGSSSVGNNDTVGDTFVTLSIIVKVKAVVKII